MSVYLPSKTLSVKEADGSIEVCPTLFSISEDIITDFEFAVMLDASDNTGTYDYDVIQKHFSKTILALNIADYIFFPTNVLFFPGSTHNTHQCANITIVDNEASEANENFSVSMKSLHTRVTLEDNLVFITIQDDDCT